MKKLISIIIAALLLTTAAVPAFAEAEPAAAIANPVVEVTDDDVFENQLGIEFDDDDIMGENKAMAIIGGELGQLCFTLKNVNDEDVEWLVRFTKNAELAGDVQAFTGIYDEKMSEPIVITNEVKDDDFTGTIDFNCIYAETENCTIYTWQFGNAFYCVCAKGEVSQMQIAAVLDMAIEATID